MDVAKWHFIHWPFIKNSYNYTTCVQNKMNYKDKDLCPEEDDHTLSVYILCNRADIHSAAAKPHLEKVHGSEN